MVPFRFSSLRSGTVAAATVAVILGAAVAPPVASSRTPMGPDGLPSLKQLPAPLPSAAKWRPPPRPLAACAAIRRSARVAKAAPARRRQVCLRAAGSVSRRSVVRSDALTQLAIAPPQPGVERSKTYGPAGPKKTLVLYDTTGEFGWLGEMYAFAAGNLATHFGSVTTMPAVDYTPGRMGAFDAVIYIGSTYNEALPADLVNDLRTTSKPVIWTGFNASQLSGPAGSPNRDAFVARYGWNPYDSFLTTDTIASVTYKGQRLTRNMANQGGVYGPHIIDSSKVAILATGECTAAGTPVDCQPVAQTTGSQVPWAIRSDNLTFISEIPFSYISEKDRYLIFADLLYPALAPNTPPIRQAAVRLEDVDPLADPLALRAVADYLASEGVPFQVAVIPRRVDPRGFYNNGVPLNVTLAQRPELVAALKYMQTKGGTLIQHGTTHQYSTLDNPYNGVSGDDFEFFRSRCSSTNIPPLTFVPCDSAPDTWVQYLGPVPADGVAWARDRVRAGRTLFTQAGLILPTIFETPHYAGSRNSYAGMRQLYATRYERTLSFGGQLLPGADPTRFFGQFFPYVTHDVNGSKILPENIGNYEPEPFNNHPAVPPAELAARARANTVVTESTASLFFHPYFPLEALRETVQGIKAEGFQFVPASQLK